MPHVMNTGGYQHGKELELCQLRSEVVLDEHAGQRLHDICRMHAVVVRIFVICLLHALHIQQGNAVMLKKISSNYLICHPSTKAEDWPNLVPETSTVISSLATLTLTQLDNLRPSHHIRILRVNFQPSCTRGLGPFLQLF